MIKLAKPQFNQGKIIEDCISNMRDGSGTSKERISASKAEICVKSKEYDALAKTGRLSTLTQNMKIVGDVTKDDMIKLYDNKFARKGEGGRSYYDAIKLLAPFGRCPFCGQRGVQTLDHYLPKSKFPIFSVTPFNLVPSCSDCNRDKLSEIFNSYNEETIHPYYDDFTDAVWIKAKLIEEDPVTFEFYVDFPEEWEYVKCERAKNHFEKFNLNNLYKLQACEEFQGCFFRIRRLVKKGGKELAIEHLEESIKEKESVRLNTWQAAMYDAIIQNDWVWEEYLPNKLNEC